MGDRVASSQKQLQTPGFGNVCPVSVCPVERGICRQSLAVKQTDVTGSGCLAHDPVYRVSALGRLSKILRWLDKYVGFPSANGWEKPILIKPNDCHLVISSIVEEGWQAVGHRKGRPTSVAVTQVMSLTPFTTVDFSSERWHHVFIPHLEMGPFGIWAVFTGSAPLPSPR